MGRKPTTVTEMARRGGKARAAKYTRDDLRRFAKNSGRPVKLDPGARRKLRRMLATGKSQTECARQFGVSTRTIGRMVARFRVAGLGD